MKLFHLIEDIQCITLCRGVFRQVDVYERDHRVYAKHGGGYVRLEGNGGTSVPSVLWKDLNSHSCIKVSGKWKAPEYNV